MKVNFGLQLPTWANFSYEENIEQALLAEKTGFNYLCVPDHFFLTPGSYNMFKTTYEKCDPTRRDMFEPWVILSAVAAVTKKVMLGPGVSPPIYYSPGRLARIIATLDHVSNGRFIFGAGVGWNEEEAKCYDIPYASFAVRFEMMKESIDVMKKLWTTDGLVTWKGKYYKIDNAPAWPKPVQKPYPPIWYGGMGEKIIKETGESGDGWCPGVGVMGGTSVLEQYKEKLSKIRLFAQKAGRNPDKIVPSAHIIMSMEKDYDRALQKYQAMMKPMLGAFSGSSERDLTESELKMSIVGTPDDCIERLERYVEAGIRHFVINPYPHPDNLEEWFKAFSEKIIPYFSKGT